ncbi:hypothetical protein E2C01_037171 [Portunus trituberculatus]|uniref:Uncharacterized protein n=1 Tax=Portunus trituberculatus TaxID=210409 RepID=A0A5B7FAN9_PORTR|nr:hypothetical protein [Portunus trituberculatus]
MVHSTNMANTVPGAPSNYVNNQVQYIPHMGNQGVVRIRMPALTIRTLSNSQGIVRIQVPTSEAQNLQNIQQLMDKHLRELQAILLGSPRSSTSGNRDSGAAVCKQPSLGQRQRESEFQQDQSLTLQSRANTSGQSNANAIDGQDVINVSSDSSGSSDRSDNLSDSSSVSGDEGAYYGGYGRCFNCAADGGATLEWTL